jgi:hypothetical protein
MHDILNKILIFIKIAFHAIDECSTCFYSYTEYTIYSYESNY